MRKAKIPTIIGILVLIIGIVAGVFLVQNRQIFKLSASPDTIPKDIRESNVNNASFTISWTTDAPTEGFVTWGTSANNLDRTATSIHESSTVHYTSIHGLEAGTTYYYTIHSAGVEYDNEGIPWELITGPELDVPSGSLIISGTILNSSGEAADETVVYATTGGGSIQSVVTSENGSWVIAISNARTQDLASFVNIDNNSTLVEIFAQKSPSVTSSAKIYPASAQPVPDMVLGEVYDFRSLAPNEDDAVPEASINVPEDSTKSSGFNVETGGGVQSDDVTIESVEESEIVTSSEPEFFGGAPPGTELTITVESEPQTSTVQATNDGSWSWSPQSSLEDGIHTITVSWVDANGFLQTLSKTFVVQAQEGPAFTSTPSATPTATTAPSPTPQPETTTSAETTPTPTPSPTATLTPSPTPTLSSATTSPTIPPAGIPTPTLVILAIGGISLIFGAAIFSLSKS